MWSNAAIGTDYLEKTWEQNYRGGQRTYDYEGVVSEGYPIERHIPAVAGCDGGSTRAGCGDGEEKEG